MHLLAHAAGSFWPHPADPWADPGLMLGQIRGADQGGLRELDI